MNDAFDVIVAGAGIIGRLTAWHLAKSGKQVLLLERHNIDNPNGSSKGSSRMFGESFASDIYFKLAHQSRNLWRSLERETGENLLHLNGGLDISTGVNSRSSIRGIASVLKSRKSKFEILSAVNLRRHYPQWRINPDTNAIYSPDSGVLRADRCMHAAIVGAKQNKTVIRENSRVIKIESYRLGTVRLGLSSGKNLYAKKLILAAGPWMPDILRRLGVNIPLQVSQEQTVYFSPRRNYDFFESNNFPVWEWEGRRFVYGFPVFENKGIKIAFHRDNRDLKNLGEFRHTPREDVTIRLREFIERHLPDAAGEAFGSTTCLYTNTPDGDFVIDTIPGMPQVFYFTGCNGHAFHCAPAIGQILTDLAIDGKTGFDISKFKMDRFSGGI